MLTVPRLVRAVFRLNRPETTLVATVGICFACALLARVFGYSVALGAFLAGALVAESGLGKPVERIVKPLCDAFAAVFFVSVGGYHHHLGLNTWQSRGGAAAPESSARLERVGFRLPNSGALDDLAERLRLCGVPFTRPLHSGGILEVRDPFGTRLAFST